MTEAPAPSFFSLNALCVCCDHRGYRFDNGLCGACNYEDHSECRRRHRQPRSNVRP